MPQLTGNKEIKLPIYEKVKVLNSKDFLFHPSLEKYEEIKK